MLFNSLSFFIFFPLVVVCYFFFPKWAQRLFILLASITFYTVYIPKYLLVMAVLILVNFLFGIQIEKLGKKKSSSVLVFSILINLFFFGFFKYFNFFSINLSLFASMLDLHYPTKILSLVLPLGLSFHTFQSISYLVEVSKGKQKAEKDFFTFALYVLFFPKLVAGPIERPQHLLPQLKKPHYFDQIQFTSGLRLMLWGYFQKIVIADRIALFVNPVYNNPQGYSGLSLIFATLFFAFQIYCDFAGYTNIARGAAKTLGINLVVNFNKPYLASSVQDFWRRWHISLSSWFRDYLYIPLGGNRISFLRTCINILVVFALTGLWHGANWTFILWGLLHGIYICLELILKKTKIKIFGFLVTLFTFSSVCFMWIFFRASSLRDAIYIISHLFSFDNQKFEGLFSKYNKNDFLISVSLIIFLVFIENYYERIRGFRLLRYSYVRFGIYYLAIFSILLLGVFSESKFIYFQF